jgi:uncharacterized protein YjbJ (UPF0337 family)
MSWNQIEGQWKQRRGMAMRHWGKMTEDKLAAIAGKYEDLVGRLQEKYGIVKEEARAQAEEFKRVDEQWKTSNNKLIGAQKALSAWKNADRTHVKSQSPKKNTILSKTNG